jgi:serine protease SohB
MEHTMGDFLIQYGLFLAKVLTIILAIGIVLVLTFSLSRKARGEDKFEIKHLNEKYRHMAMMMKGAVLAKKAFKAELKAEKARRKAEQRKTASESSKRKKRIFVINFHGDIKATAVASLREEVSAILSLATPDDEVLVKLENHGGLVHEHGFAASQLRRIREKNIPLTVAVDKVAASGGYMMACVAQTIIAAPFAVLGSIGVLAQLPNFHRLLNRHGVEFEQIKAGELKRTLTMFGVNTEEDRAKFSEQLEDTHRLFKEFVAQHRPALDIDKVSTGEHWFGQRAVDLKLVDKLITSDDYLLGASENSDLYEISYTVSKSIGDRLASVVQLTVEKLILAGWQRVLHSYFIS